MDVTGNKFQHQSSTPKIMELQYLRAITKQFSEDQILGNGGFGTVYKVPEKWRRRLQTTSNYTSLEEDCRQVNQCIEVGLKCMERKPKKRPNIREIIEMLNGSENMNSCSVREDGSDVEEQSGEVVSPDWREALDIIASCLSEESVEGMKVIGHELGQMVNSEPEYIIKDADRLVSYLAVMVQKTFNLGLSGASSRSCKYTLNSLMQAFRITRLAHAVKEGTLENLIAELLVWLVVDKVPQMDDGDQLLKALNAVMLKILVLESTTDEIDIDRILQSIHTYMQEPGMEEIRRRAGTDDKPLRMVQTVLHELVKLRRTAIKDHLSMVPADAEPRPLILGYIDVNLQALAV